MQLWGNKTISMFDIWSFEHILAGIAITGIVCFFLGTQNKNIDKFLNLYNITIVLMLSFMWEIIEHYLETGLLGSQVESWFSGVEHWSNRLIGDSLAILLGSYIYFKFPKTLVPTKIVSMSWLLLHIVYLPDSMYLQQFI